METIFKKSNYFTFAKPDQDTVLDGEISAGI